MEDGVWNSRENIVRSLASLTVFWPGPFPENLGCRGISPSPHPSERVDRRGFSKTWLQNIEHKEVRGQNLDNRKLRAFLAHRLYTASALTIFYLFRFVGKVRRHRVCKPNPRTCFTH